MKDELTTWAPFDLLWRPFCWTEERSSRGFSSWEVLPQSAVASVVEGCLLFMYARTRHDIGPQRRNRMALVTHMTLYVRCMPRAPVARRSASRHRGILPRSALDPKSQA